MPDQVTGPCFQSILMIIEAPETRSHSGECVRYDDLADVLLEWVPELLDNCYPIPDTRKKSTCHISRFYSAINPRLRLLLQLEYL